ncbi:MAG: nuclear transport factor 2 family protein [Acidobacteriota bacterium]
MGSLLAVAAWAGPQTHPRSGIPRAEKHEIRHQIDRLEEQWRTAILSSNTAVMNALLGEDYLAITPFGTLETKDQTLDGLRSGRWRFTSLNLFDRKVRFYGSTALVTSLAEVQATTPEGNISGKYRYTRVYAKNARGQWKIVNFEASRVHRIGDRN